MERIASRLAKPQRLGGQESKYCRKGSFSLGEKVSNRLSFALLGGSYLLDFHLILEIDSRGPRTKSKAKAPNIE